ncbi:hypothetical protein QBC39DRAFT_89466 [Podospora conica]|nr:hypothetical protein QBC39DRAFT_89466 [Schizothecium conicum]
MEDSTTFLFPEVVAPNGRAFGWLRDPPDARDRTFASELAQRAPEESNRFFEERATTGKLRAGWIENAPGDPLPIYNQQRMGSCVANAVAAALRHAWKQQPVIRQDREQKLREEKKYDPEFLFEKFDPSRLWIYYHGRTPEYSLTGQDLTPYDAGMNIRNAIKLVRKIGVCREEDWPYKDGQREAETKVINGREVSVFPPGHAATIKPDAKAQQRATEFITFPFEYFRIRAITDDEVKVKPGLTAEQLGILKRTEVEQMKACIAEGYPVIYGFGIFENTPFGAETWTPEVDRFMEFPEKPGKRKNGHAVLAIGYNDDKKAFLCQNSWGPGWKKGPLEGKFWMPYSWFSTKRNDAHPAYDLWVIRPKNAPITGFHPKQG